METIRDKLISLADQDYMKFNQKLCPDTKRPMLGIKVPTLRNLAKDILKEYDAKEILNSLEMTTIASNTEPYFEEIVLRGFIIGYAKISLKEKLEQVKNFIPRIDSWFICDTFVPTLKIKEKDKETVWDFMIPYTKSDEEFEIRFAVIMMLDYYITDEYIDRVIQTIDTVQHEGYYVKMAAAWLISVIVIKFQEKGLSYLQNNNLDKFTFNKALQKLIESYRITDGQKQIFKSMKRK